MDSKRYAVILNPFGGKGRAGDVLRKVRPVLESGGEICVLTTNHSGHASEIAAGLDPDLYDGCVVIGGDGTIHETITGMMSSERTRAVPLGVIPGGTGNSVAMHFQLDDPIAAAERIVAGRTEALDVMRVKCGEQEYFCVNIVGWGAPVAINRIAERLRILGPSRYSIAALAHISSGRFSRAKLTLDGDVTEDDFAMIIACNTRSAGSKMLLAPDAVTNDGLIDVVVVRKTNRRNLLGLFGGVYDGTHLERDCAECIQVKSFSVDTVDPQSLNLDGEIKGTSPVTVTTLPGQLQIFA